MTILTLNRKELEREIGKINEEMESKIAGFGTPIDRIDENEVSIEVFPNRPDLLSKQGFIRGFLAFLGKKIGKNEFLMKIILVIQTNLRVLVLIY